MPATSGDVYTPTLALKGYYLSLLLLSVRLGVLQMGVKPYTDSFPGQPTSRILDLEVAIRDGAVRKIGKFADIYQGKVLTKSSDIPIPVRHIRCRFYWFPDDTCRV